MQKKMVFFLCCLVVQQSHAMDPEFALQPYQGYSNRDSRDSLVSDNKGRGVWSIFNGEFYPSISSYSDEGTVVERKEVLKLACFNKKRFLLASCTTLGVLGLFAAFYSFPAFLEGDCATIHEDFPL